MKTNNKEIVLPFFSGFYNSIHSKCIDMCIESYGIDWEKIDYKATHNQYASDYVQELNRLIDTSLIFKDIDSPKFYNYSTDRLFCEVSDKEAMRIYNEVIDTPELEEYVKDAFSSRPGFIPFYSNDVQDWKNKPLIEYDHNELGVLLEVLAAFEFSDIDNEISINRELETELHELKTE